MTEMKHFSKKTLLVICGVAVAFLLGVLAIIVNYTLRVTRLENDMKQVAIMASEQVANELEACRDIARTLGFVEALSDDTVSITEKSDILQQWAIDHDVDRCRVIDSDGVGLDDGLIYTDRAYYQAALRGETLISEPVVSKITGKATFVVSAPLYKGDEIVGCVYVVPYEGFFSRLMYTAGTTNIKEMDDRSSAYMIDKMGNIIAAPNMEIVKQGEPLTDGVNSGFDSVLAIRKKMMAGETGFGSYESHGQRMIAGYSPVENTDGWSLMVFSSQSNFVSDICKSSIVIIIIVTSLSLVFVAFIRKHIK